MTRELGGSRVDGNTEDRIVCRVQQLRHNRDHAWRPLSPSCDDDETAVLEQVA